MRVLLVSPVRGVDPLSGDVVYTENLLDEPPDGIEYVTYDVALRDGDLVELGRRGWHRRPGSRRRRAYEGWVFAVRQVERLARSSGLAFREAFRYFEVRPGAFDVVHAHVFSIRLVGPRAGLVVSTACPLRQPYTDAWGWPPWRARVAELFDAGLGRLMGVNVFSGRTPQADRVVVFTEEVRPWFEARSGVPVEVIPNFVEDPGVRAPGPDDGPPSHLGFIATDFVAKGGDLVLAAFERLRAERPDVRLTIVGSEPQGSEAELERRGITWLGRIERERITGEVLPSLDLLLYPTTCDGLPFVLLEALAAGVPCVTSDYGAMAEVIGAGGIAVAGRDPSVYARTCAELLDPARHDQVRAAARARFVAAYRAEAVRPALAAAYRSASARRR